MWNRYRMRGLFEHGGLLHSQYRRHQMLCTGVCKVNHSEVYGNLGSKTNVFISIRLSRLFPTLAVKTIKSTRLSKFKETEKLRIQCCKKLKENIQGILE